MGDALIILLAFHDAHMDCPVMLNVALIDHISEQQRGMLTFSVKGDSFSIPMTMAAYMKHIATASASRSPVAILEL